MKRKIEIFSAGCDCCHATVQSCQEAACPSCEITVLDMHQPDVAERARSLDIRRVPAVLIDGHVADCCWSGGPDLDVLRAAGLGQPLDS